MIRYKYIPLVALFNLRVLEYTTHHILQIITCCRWSICFLDTG